MKKTLVAFLLSASCLIADDITLYHHQDHLSTELMQKMITLFKVDTLVETGTYAGATAINASPYFRDVYTVELDPKTYLETKRKLASYKNIHPYMGTSFNFLTYPEVTQLETPLFWLDAHYSGGNTGTLYNEKNWVLSPLKKELEIILSKWSQKGVILIDDLRGYLNLRPEDKVGREYATVNELYKMAKACHLEFYVLGDMGIVFNKNIYPLTISPYVQACTVSYTYNPFASNSAEDVLQLLKAENVIMKAGPSAELDGVISQLSHFPLNSHDWSGYYPTIWKSLREMGRGDYHGALAGFQSLVAVDPNIDSRIFLYMAECYKDLGDTVSQEVYLGRVSADVHEAAKLLALGD